MSRGKAKCNVDWTMFLSAAAVHRMTVGGLSSLVPMMSCGDSSGPTPRELTLQTAYLKVYLS